MRASIQSIDQLIVAGKIEKVEGLSNLRAISIGRERRYLPAVAMGDRGAIYFVDGSRGRLMLLLSMTIRRFLSGHAAVSRRSRF